MMDIEKKKTDLNPQMIAKKSFQPTKTLNTTKRVRELKKINDENKNLLKRLQSAHSVYSIDKWIEDDRKHNEFKRNISQNARRTQHSDLAKTPISKTFYSQTGGQSNGFQAGMYYEY